MDRNKKILIDVQNAPASRDGGDSREGAREDFGDGEDSIFGGEQSMKEFSKERVEPSDLQTEIVNTSASDLPHLLVTRKRKRSGPGKVNQEHREAKKRCLEDGYPNVANGIRMLFIFNYVHFTNPKYEERKGSENDVRSLRKTFSNLGFKTVSYEDLSYEDTFRKLREIQQRCKNGDTHMIVLALMTHGDQRDADSFVTSDDKSVSMNQVRSMFSNGNCEGLLGKPKIFLAIFCRNISASDEEVAQSPPTTEYESSSSNSTALMNEDGYDPDVEKWFLSGFTWSDTNLLDKILNIENNANDKASTMEIDGQIGRSVSGVFNSDDLQDMTTVYSTKPGIVSYRCHRTGTVMVQCLCEVLDEYGQTYPFNDCYRLLQRAMKAEQTGGRSEYCFSPDRDDLELKTCFFADLCDDS